MRRPALLSLFAFVIALSVVHAIVAFWTPVMGDDWNHWIWAGRHHDDPSWLTSFLTSHVTFSDVMGYVLARCRVFHVLVTPAILIALIVGLFTAAMRRIPRVSSDDVISLALISALIWVGQPQAAVTLFHTPNVAHFVYGSALAAWFIAPLRCNWRVPRPLWPLLAIAGYCVGTSTRAIATAAFVYFLLVLRNRREPWMWIAFAGLVVGLVVGYIVPPWLEVGRVFNRGFEQNLVGTTLVKFFIAEQGELVSFVLAFVLADILLGVFRRGRAPVDARPDPKHALHWFVAWFAVSCWSLFGPKYDEAMLLPTTLLLIIAELPTLAWLAQSYALRRLLIATVVAIHLVAWTIAVVRYHDIGEQGAARMRILESTPFGQVAVVPPYQPVPASFWFYGEDFDIARMRSLVAIEAFGLRDIEIKPAFRRLDTNPHIELALETDGDLRGLTPPTIWAGDVDAARKQFDIFVKKLRERGSKAAARLRVTNIELPERGTRALLAAWDDASGTMIPRVVRSAIDPNGEFTVRIYEPDAKTLDEAYIIEDGRSRTVPYRNGALRLRPRSSVLNVAVGCNKQRCFVADAFLPHF